MRHRPSKPRGWTMAGDVKSLFTMLEDNSILKLFFGFVKNGTSRNFNVASGSSPRNVR